MPSGRTLRIARAIRLWRLAAFAAMALCSMLAFLFSRGLAPFAGLNVSSPGIVMLYAALGFGWAIVLQGAIDSLKCLSGGAAMALAGAVIVSRSTGVPPWLAGSVAAAVALALMLNARLILQDAQARSGSFGRRLWSSLVARIPDSARTIAAKELELWTAVLHPASLNRKYTGLTQFTMGRSGSDVMVMKVLIGIGLIELFAVHLVLQALYPTLALILTAISAILLVYLFGVARSLTAVPTTLAADTLTVRLGALRQQVIPLEQIAAVGPVASGQEGSGDILTLAIIDPSNVRLQLHEPLPGRGLFGTLRSYRWVDFRTDDPARLIQALETALGLRRWSNYVITAPEQKPQNYGDSSPSP